MNHYPMNEMKVGLDVAPLNSYHLRCTNYSIVTTNFPHCVIINWKQCPYQPPPTPPPPRKKKSKQEK